MPPLQQDELAVIKQAAAHFAESAKSVGMRYTPPVWSGVKLLSF